MVLQSIVIDLNTNNSKVVPTKDLHVDMSQSGTLLRGQGFFSSAFTVQNDQGVFLFARDAHYDRLLQSYQRLYERLDFPISQEAFNTYIQRAIDENKGQQSERLHCSILCFSGPGRAQDSDDGVYANGFGSELTRLVIMIANMAAKPAWCYSTGVHLLSMPYQRSHAIAKPTQYWGGIDGQNCLDALNTATWLYIQKTNESLEDAKEQILERYNSLSTIEKTSFRRVMNSVLDCLSEKRPLESYEYAYRVALPTDIHNSLPKSISTKDIAHFKTDFKHCFSDMFHEVLFCSPEKPSYLLEGSTFSLLAVRDNQLVFLPLEGNTQKDEDLNTGYILESTTMSVLRSIAKKQNISHRIEPIRFSDLSKLQALYCVSTTRFKYQNQSFALQPCASVDAVAMKTTVTPVYMQLMEAFTQYVATYSYTKHEDVAVGVEV